MLALFFRDFAPNSHSNITEVVHLQDTDLFHIILKAFDGDQMFVSYTSV